MRTARYGLAVFLVMAVAACGGDDDTDRAAEPASEPAASEPAAEPADGGGTGADSIVGTVLQRGFGLTDDILSDAERACMDGALAPVFPDGVPDDLVLTDELVDAIDDAAASCNVELGF